MHTVLLMTSHVDLVLVSFSCVVELPAVRYRSPEWAGDVAEGVEGVVADCIGNDCCN